MGWMVWNEVGLSISEHGESAHLTHQGGGRWPRNAWASFRRLFGRWLLQPDRLHSAMGYRPTEESEQAVPPVTSSALATMPWFRPREQSVPEGAHNVNQNIQPTDVC
jgi:hypothetical protein